VGVNQICELGFFVFDGLPDFGWVLWPIVFLGYQRTHTLKVLILSYDLSDIVLKFNCIMSLMHRILMKQTLTTYFLVTLETIKIIYEVMLRTY
jgi:hypothetical protein